MVLRNPFKREKKEGWESSPEKTKPKLRKKKYRLGILKHVKRFLAGVCVIIHLAFTISIVESNTVYNKDFSLFFLVSAFLLIDYLWKTKKFKVVYGDN